MKFEALDDIAFDERISVRIPGAVRLTGMSRSRIYQLMKTGELEYFKVGGSTLIATDTLRRFIENRRSMGKARTAQ